MRKLGPFLSSVLILAITQSSAVAATSTSPLAPPVPTPQPTPIVYPLTDAQLKDPAGALATSRKTVGDGWARFGGLYLMGIAQIQGQTLPFTYAVDLKTGYNRTIILLPRNAGTLEYGLDREGGWSATGGFVRPFTGTPQSITSALYVARFGLFKSDAASLKEIGNDEKIGDRIAVTPAGGVAVLAILKPATSLLSAVQFANGQVTIYADYRRINGVLYPFRTMQGTDAKALSVFQASSVLLTPDEPDAAPVTRPALPIATPAPQTSASATPTGH